MLRWPVSQRRSESGTVSGYCGMLLSMFGAFGAVIFPCSIIIAIR